MALALGFMMRSTSTTCTTSSVISKMKCEPGPMCSADTSFDTGRTSRVTRAPRFSCMVNGLDANLAPSLVTSTR